MTLTATDLDTTAWESIHCHLRWSGADVDRFLLTVVAPALDGFRADGLLVDWFFIRYGADGPHVRIRLRGPAPGVSEHLCAVLRESVHGSPATVVDRPDEPAGWRAHATVEHADYEPETRRYGGTTALAVAEDVFCRSSEIAVAVLASTPAHAGRLNAAIDLMMATARALDLDAKDTARWLRTNACTWRWHRRGDMVEPARAQNAALASARSQGAVIRRRWAAAPVAGGVVAGWTHVVREARTQLEHDGPGPWWLGVWASQLHMLCNRLGLLPDEERTLSWFIAASLLAPPTSTDYFGDGVDAADRAFLDAGRYEQARMPAQQPRDIPPPPPLIERNPFAGPSVPLPSAELPPVSLAECLSRRRSGRGDLGSRITAAQLGTVLWSAHAPTGTPVRWGPDGTEEFRRRPYPSAGAQFTAKLRVIVRDVDGVEPGLYGVDPNERTLVPQAGRPGDDEITAASMWFVDSSPAHDRIDVTRMPALLGVHISFGTLRLRYGMRALRFALLEAGHLAQTVGLAATASGLTVGTIGGFYDDIAHELFMLDGVDDVLVYLLPLGRQR